MQFLTKLWFPYCMSVEATYTIDELARVADTTVRSVRVYHERGTLPPPQVRGRTGYYGPEHLSRLRTIGRLLDRGMKLNGIKELLDAWDRGDGLAEVLDFAHETSNRYDIFPIERVSTTELEARFRDVPHGLKRAVALGLYEPVDDATYRVLNPRLKNLATRLATAGLPLAEVLDELEKLKKDCDRIAKRYADIFDRVSWDAYQHSEQGPDDLAALTDALATFRVVPARAAVELLSQTLHELTSIQLHEADAR